MQRILKSNLLVSNSLAFTLLDKLEINPFPWFAIVCVLLAYWLV